MEHRGLEAAEHRGQEPVTEHRGLEHHGLEPVIEHRGQEPPTLTTGPGGTPTSPREEHER